MNKTSLTKTCSLCHETKSLSDFYTRVGNREQQALGIVCHKAECKACDIRAAAEWKARNPAKVRAARLREAAKVYLSRPGLEPPPIPSRSIAFPSACSPTIGEPQPLPVGSKVCTQCGVDKPLARYRRKNKKSDPVPIWMNECADCNRARINDWKRRNPEKVKDQVWRAAARKYLAAVAKTPEEHTKPQ